jgi:hypothetical protein
MAEAATDALSTAEAYHRAWTSAEIRLSFDRLGYVAQRQSA